MKDIQCPFSLAVFLLIVKSIWNMSLLISEKSANEIVTIDKNFENITSIVLFRSFKHDEIILIGFFILNCFAIILSLSQFLLHWIGTPQFKSSTKVSSFLAMTYNYVIFVPSIFFSVNITSKYYLSIPNLIFTIIIGMHIDFWKKQAKKGEGLVYYKFLTNITNYY